jgi:hypothetical protein
VVTISPDGYRFGISGPCDSFKLIEFSELTQKIVKEGFLSVDGAKEQRIRLLATGSILDDADNVVSTVTSATLCRLVSENMFELTYENSQFYQTRYQKRAQIAQGKKSKSFSTSNSIDSLQWVESIHALKLK